MIIEGHLNDDDKELANKPQFLLQHVKSKFATINQC